MKKGRGKWLVTFGLLLLLLDVTVLDYTLDLIEDENYRGHMIYYDTINHDYVVPDLGGTHYASKSAAKEAINAYENRDPTADADGPYSGNVGESISFSGSATDPDTAYGDSIQSWEWDFGDGGHSSSKNPSHTYSSAGSYSVHLEVTDKYGGIDGDTTSATISTPNQPPHADANGPYSAEVGNSVHFSSSGSNDPDGSITEYRWNFGDGSGYSYSANPSHSYSSAGSYTATLRVTDNDGATDSDSASVSISNPPAPDPDGDFYINGQKVTASSTVYASSATVTIKFIATADASDITNVRFRAYDYESTLIINDYLTKISSNTWEEDQTFPGEGTYTVQGHVLWDGGSKRLMAILTYVEEGEVEKSDLSHLGWAGVICVALGFFLDRKEVKL